MYGFDGQHRRDFGRPGQGPGELEQPFSLFVTDSGNVGVSSFSGAGAFKVSFFTAAGEFLEDWRIGQMTGGPGVTSIPSLTVPVGDLLMVGVQKRPDDFRAAVWKRQVGLQLAGPDGLQGDPWLAPELESDPPVYELTQRGFSFQRPVPWAPSRTIVAALPSGDRVWTHADAYRFFIEHPNGETLIVERVTNPVRIDPDEAEYRRRIEVQRNRRQNPEFDWNGAGMPDTKPWIRMFVTDQSGRIWVSRQGPGHRVEPCTDPLDTQPGLPSTPCWESQPLLDIFAADGSYLGALERPEGLTLLGPFIRGDIIVAGYLDELGTNKIRVYRLVIPSSRPDSATE